jgi:hypothetical protein
LLWTAGTSTLRVPEWQERKATMSFRKAERMVALAGLLAALVALLGCKKLAHRGESSSSSGGDKIGIAECDDFLAKYEKCIEKMPAVARPGAEQSIKTMRETWKKVAETPSAKTGMASMCKQAAEGVKSSMGPYNCQW